MNNNGFPQTLEEAQTTIQTLQAELEETRKASTTKDLLVQAFLKASQAVLSSRSFDQIARQIFDLSIDLIGATSGYIALLSDDGAENEVLFLEAGGRPCSVDPELPMPIRGLRAEAYHSMEVVYDNDFMRSQWVEWMPSGHVNLDNVMFAPLNIDGKTVGIMGIANKPSEFTAEDAKVAAVFGELAAIALRRTRDLELLNQLANDLQRSNEELEQFAYIVSHDLKEPLRTISSYLKLIEKRYKDNLDDNGNEFIHFAVDGSNRMRKMIEGLLKYSRVGAQKGEFFEFSMHETLQQVLQNLDAIIKDRGAAITWDKLPDIHGDAIQIAELLQNLISNSIKFSDRDEPKIYIGVEERKSDWLFYVRDKGIGFDSEAIGEHIFGMFKRIHRDQQPDGSGIGLAVCKKIVTRHDGEIWAQSRIGEGATFYFKIPKVLESKGH